MDDEYTGYLVRMYSRVCNSCIMGFGEEPVMVCLTITLPVAFRDSMVFHIQGHFSCLD
jgi:hypothetical protein